MDNVHCIVKVAVFVKVSGQRQLWCKPLSPSCWSLFKPTFAKVFTNLIKHSLLKFLFKTTSIKNLKDTLVTANKPWEDFNSFLNNFIHKVERKKVCQNCSFCWCVNYFCMCKICLGKLLQQEPKLFWQVWKFFL